VNIGTNACIGMGVPYAVGAKLAVPDRPVVCISGDSAFGFNGFEIETAVRHQLPIVFIVNVNQGVVGVGAGRDIEDPEARQKLLQIGGLGVGSFVPDARHDKIMEAFGGHGEYVERPEQIRPALERSFAIKDRPSLINVKTDPFFGDFLPRKGYRQEMQY
jgi:thiamine pyrophosphate-dependent acetolactate synthase large subunit-like protein